ncbi:conserved hypothetical protein [Candidatus Magnetomoraceae bacterium gMMP-1]
MGINFHYKTRATEEKHGKNAIESSSDFSSKKDLKNAIKHAFNNFECPICGGHRMDSSKIIVEIGKVRFFKQVKKKGLFGSKYVDKHDRNVYRIHRIYLEPSAFLSPAGYIRCKSCKWEEKGGKSLKWLSINDVINGRL